ncbi:MAG: hypothetical protein JST39_05380, partial [Bacteroidetes bacterium]|nr:hypothetical protein [Bacteroidota bacterium]
MLIVCLLAGLTMRAQQVTLSYKNEPALTVLQDIEKQTGYFFFYDRSLLRLTGRITVDVKNVSLDEALSACFKNKPVSVLKAGKTITLQKAKINPSPPEQPANTMIVKGSVVNQNGEAVLGATIMVKGTNMQVMAND